MFIGVLVCQGLVYAFPDSTLRPHLLFNNDDKVKSSLPKPETPVYVLSSNLSNTLSDDSGRIIEIYNKMLLAIEDAKRDGYRFFRDGHRFFKEFLIFGNDASIHLKEAFTHIIYNTLQHNNFRDLDRPIYKRIFYEKGDIVIQIIAGGESKINEEIEGKRFLVKDGVPEQPISDYKEPYSAGRGIFWTFLWLNKLTDGFKDGLIAPNQSVSISWFHDKSGEFPEYANDPYNPVVTEIRLPLQKTRVKTIDSLNSLTKMHLLHSIGNCTFTFVLGLLIDSLKNPQPEFIDLCIKTRDQWRARIRAIIEEKGFNIEALLEIIENTIDSMEPLIKKAESLLEDREFKDGSDEILYYIDNLKSDKDSLSSFLKLLSALQASANINEIISIYTETWAKVDYELRLFSEESLIFKKAIENESLIIFSIIDNFFRDVKTTITTAKEGDKWIKIEVSDVGPGITKKGLLKIFAEGFTTKKESEGGQGLYLTLEYLKLKNGRIEVNTKTARGEAWKLTFDDKLEEREISKSDRTEKGTTFTIWLPLASEKTTLPTDSLKTPLKSL